MPEFGVPFLFQNSWKIFESHFLGQILVSAYTIYQHNQILTRQFPVDHLSYPIVSTLAVLQCIHLCN